MSMASACLGSGVHKDIRHNLAWNNLQLETNGILLELVRYQSVDAATVDKFPYAQQSSQFCVKFTAPWDMLVAYKKDFPGVQFVTQRWKSAVAQLSSTSAFALKTSLEALKRAAEEGLAMPAGWEDLIRDRDETSLKEMVTKGGYKQIGNSITLTTAVLKDLDDFAMTMVRGGAVVSEELNKLSRELNALRDKVGHKLEPLLARHK